MFYTAPILHTCVYCCRAMEEIWQEEEEADLLHVLLFEEEDSYIGRQVHIYMSEVKGCGSKVKEWSSLSCNQEQLDLLLYFSLRSL